MKTLHCGYSLEAPQQGASIEYHNIYCFHGKIRKYQQLFLVWKLALSSYDGKFEETDLTSSMASVNGQSGQSLAGNLWMILPQLTPLPEI